MTTQPAPDHVRIFDTTLRDGEQSPGCSMGLAEKLEMARQLARLRVDIIEAGFPAVSEGDREAVRAVASEVEGPRIAALARCVPADIDAAWDALRHAPRPRIHVFLATSALHREFKLRMAKREILRRTVDSVARARDLTEDVEFSPEDGSRTEPEFLGEVVERAIAAGASTINIPDTVGYTMPDEFVGLIGYLRRHVAGIDGIVLSVHCHNDLGMAVANSLAAVRAGARQVECTVNGIGERAGNASLEEVVMSLATRHDFYGISTGVETREIVPASRLLSELTGMLVQRNKAIVGRNAFAHEAGIHQHGVLRNRATYEIMHPHDVGLGGNELVLGKHSGRHALRARLGDLGFDPDRDELNEVFVAFKRLADRVKEVSDEDLLRLMSETAAVPASGVVGGGPEAGASPR